jgi:outer membrane murein-binding lipoprotein Lpp
MSLHKEIKMFARISLIAVFFGSLLFQGCASNPSSDQATSDKNVGAATLLTKGAHC